MTVKCHSTKVIVIHAVFSVGHSLIICLLDFKEMLLCDSVFSASLLGPIISLKNILSRESESCIYPMYAVNTQAPVAGAESLMFGFTVYTLEG